SPTSTTNGEGLDDRGQPHRHRPRLLPLRLRPGQLRLQDPDQVVPHPRLDAALSGVCGRGNDPETAPASKTTGQPATRQGGTVNLLPPPVPGRPPVDAAATKPPPNP